MALDLEKREINGGRIVGSIDDEFRLILPEIEKGRYGLAQLDDYMHLSRRQFSYKPPLTLQLEARVTSKDHQGTWGFGLWNDPFSMGFSAGGMSRLLPVFPNAAWFFYGSDQNCLSLRDDQPGSGFHVKTYRSPIIPSVMSLLAVPALPLLFFPAVARLMRRAARGIVKEDAHLLNLVVDSWHIYKLVWEEYRVVFVVDGVEVFKTRVSPQGRLGLVIWIDNQYFRFDSEGHIGFGFLRTLSHSELLIRNTFLNDE